MRWGLDLSTNSKLNALKKQINEKGIEKLLEESVNYKIKKRIKL